MKTRQEGRGEAAEETGPAHAWISEASVQDVGINLCYVGYRASEAAPPGRVRGQPPSPAHQPVLALSTEFDHLPYFTLEPKTAGTLQADPR